MSLRTTVSILPALVSMLLALQGCLLPGPPSSAQLNNEPPPTLRERIAQQAREGPPVNTSVNLYEGSLWRGTSSWGNLMRDHRARFRGDLLTIRDLSEIINVPDVITDPDDPGNGAAEDEDIEFGDPVLRYLEERRRRREEIDRERSQILSDIKQVEVQVVRVLPNGNLLVQGAHPPIFRDNNRVKYLFNIQGIVSPRDVAGDNTVLSSKLGKSEYKLTRLVRNSSIPRGAGAVARATGDSRTGALLDRFTDFLTLPSQSNAGTVQ